MYSSGWLPSLTVPDFDQPRGNVYVWLAVPLGRLKLREGPVRVAKVTRQLLPWRSHCFAWVGVYHDSPWSTRSGAMSHTSVLNGSNALGQPFQPSSAVAPSVAPDHVCHVPRRSGWPKSVPPSSTPTVEPSPAYPARHALAKSWVRASMTPSFFSSSKCERARSGALSYGTSSRLSASRRARSVALDGRWLSSGSGMPRGLPVCLSSTRPTDTTP